MESNLPPPIPPAPTPILEAGRPFGFWATVGIGLLIGIAYMIAQVAVVAGFAIARGLHEGFDAEKFKDFALDGRAVAAATLASAPVVTGLCILAAWLRKGIPWQEYLAWRWLPWKAALKWFLGFVVFLVVVDVGLSQIKGEKTEEFMKDMLSTAPGGWMALLWVALMVGAPVSEEIFFRGFIFAGLQNSWLGGYGAAIVTALAFACIHLQYDLQGFLFILLVGLFFGIARLKTGSLWLCIALHSVMNLAATLYYLVAAE